ncbi:MAG: hypothetical protein K2Q14_07870 [Gammaproteobacteria bacterium]|nr:hypothetical protein [Gammaproteobacteria bacterium]
MDNKEHKQEKTIVGILIEGIQESERFMRNNEVKQQADLDKLAKEIMTNSHGQNFEKKSIVCTRDK